MAERSGNWREVRGESRDRDGVDDSCRLQRSRDVRDSGRSSHYSGAGNGPFGFGWSLSLPTVVRKTERGLPQYPGRR
ncbi:SpvB/TcaC N-terminal domain-containing protein [Pseudarthrobacter oxydans]|uniref:SpvB/TcaC N-terminal domain-containing protein n=1 Tax=Pseudarthrobacter oxydans TaxID=1671 RepID=UPI0035219C71